MFQITLLKAQEPTIDFYPRRQRRFRKEVFTYPLMGSGRFPFQLAEAE
jgi:hypothetical protein